MNLDHIKSTIPLFQYYKELGDKTFDQLSDKHLFQRLDPDGNSIAIIVNHMWGNMMSRWTDFLTKDGEKEWRKRDLEFEEIIKDRTMLLEKWEEGWAVLFAALKMIDNENMDTTIYIRNLGHTIVEACNRQLGHYAYHVGQIVFLGKHFSGPQWNSLSIPKSGSKDYNEKRFKADKTIKTFVDQLREEKKNEA